MYIYMYMYVYIYIYIYICVAKRPGAPGRAPRETAGQPAVRSYYFKRVSICVYIYIYTLYSLYICICICICVCVCVCMYIYIYIHTHGATYIQPALILFVQASIYSVIYYSIVYMR